MDIIINNEEPEQGTSYSYLGQILSEDERHETEIKTTMGMARHMLNTVKTVLLSRRIYP